LVPCTSKEAAVPELPEVEVTRRGIAPLVVGRRIVAIEVREPRLRWRVPRALAGLAGCRVRSVKRRGKYLLIDCGRGHLIVHLGMSGSLRVVDARDPPGRHDHVDFAFAAPRARAGSGRALRLRDPRRFGAVLWTQEAPLAHPLLRHLGVEPLSRAFDARRLHALTRGHRTSIKQFLMDARRIAGLGNIYASESLFLAGIRPQTPARRLSLARCVRLVAAIRATLRAAIRAGGSSLRDYVDGAGALGSFQTRCDVYGRAGEPCRRCGSAVRCIRQGQRATYYCPRCQR
jgi:formamidopyrimidine-DNA glycosylase